ncbi:MAG: hypothetical protein OEM91_05100 [Hyphomicrobiales bacterium]|nr:hypothetical protein [Hyphomicrobiales bacterium]
MRYVLLCLLTFTFGTLLGEHAANAASIEGNWSGSGTVRLTEGGTEAVRCRIRYEKGSGRTFVLHVTCAHSNGTFKVSGRIVQLSGGNRYSGRLYSDQYSVAGDVGISVSGTRQTLTAKSKKGSATVKLTKQ